MKSDKDVTKIKRVTFFLRHSVCMWFVVLNRRGWHRWRVISAPHLALTKSDKSVWSSYDAAANAAGGRQMQLFISH